MRSASLNSNFNVLVCFSLAKFFFSPFRQMPALQSSKPCSLNKDWGASVTQCLVSSQTSLLHVTQQSVSLLLRHQGCLKSSPIFCQRSLSGFLTHPSKRHTSKWEIKAKWPQQKRLFLVYSHAQPPIESWTEKNPTGRQCISCVCFPKAHGPNSLPPCQPQVVDIHINELQAIFLSCDFAEDIPFIRDEAKLQGPTTLPDKNSPSLLSRSNRRIWMCPVSKETQGSHKPHHSNIPSIWTLIGLRQIFKPNSKPSLLPKHIYCFTYIGSIRKDVTVWENTMHYQKTNILLQMSMFLSSWHWGEQVLTSLKTCEPPQKHGILSTKSKEPKGLILMDVRWSHTIWSTSLLLWWVYHPPSLHHICLIRLKNFLWLLLYFQTTSVHPKWLKSNTDEISSMHISLFHFFSFII